MYQRILEEKFQDRSSWNDPSDIPFDLAVDRTIYGALSKTVANHDYGLVKAKDATAHIIYDVD